MKPDKKTHPIMGTYIVTEVVTNEYLVEATSIADAENRVTNSELVPAGGEWVIKSVERQND